MGEQLFPYGENVVSLRETIFPSMDYQLYSSVLWVTHDNCYSFTKERINQGMCKLWREELLPEAHLNAVK